MSNPYLNRTGTQKPSSSYLPTGMSSNIVSPGTQRGKCNLDEKDILLNIIGKQRNSYRRARSPLTGNEQAYGQIEDLSGFLDDSYGYLPIPTQRQMTGNYVTSPQYGHINQGMTWNCDFKPVPKGFQDKQTQTYYEPFNNFNAFQPRMERFTNFHPQYLSYDFKRSHYPDIPLNYPINPYPYLTPYYPDSTDLRYQYLNSNLNFPSPSYDKKFIRNPAVGYNARSNFGQMPSQFYDVREYSNIGRRNIQMNDGINDAFSCHQSYSPYYSSFIDGIDNEADQNSFDFRLPPPPQYATQPTLTRSSFPYTGTIERGTDVNIDQFDSNTETVIRSPRIQQFTPQYSWMPLRSKLPKYCTRDENHYDIPDPLHMNVKPSNFITEELDDSLYNRSCFSENLYKSSRPYSLQKTVSPTEFERNYITKQTKPHRSCNIPVGNRSLQQDMNRTISSPHNNLNRPRAFSHRRNRSPVSLERKKEDASERNNLEVNINDSVSLKPRRASNVDISSFVTNNELSEMPISKSFSDSSIDMTDDSSYLPSQSKKSQGTNLKRFKPLPKLHEEPTADPDYGPVKEHDYYEENTQLLTTPKKSSEDVFQNDMPINTPQTSTSQQKNSGDWDDLWDPNSIFTATEMETNPAEVEQWEFNHRVKKEEEELDNLAENIIESMTQKKEVTPLFNASLDLQNASSSRTFDQSIYSENDCQRKENFKDASAPQMGQELKTKGKQAMGSKMKLVRGKTNRRKSLEEMYNSITEDILY